MLALARLLGSLLLLGCVAGPAPSWAQAPAPTTAPPAAGKPADKIEIATFAGGCFWCVEEAFEKVPGVLSAVSGYTGGSVPNPSYQQVSHGSTGHAEAVRVTYDPARVTYARLVDWFCAGFSDACNADPSTRSDGRRPRSAKARNRG